MLRTFYALYGVLVNPIFRTYWGVPISSKDWVRIQVFGANIRRERLAKAMTQEKLAEIADLHLRTLQKIEAGEINLLLTTVLRLKDALKCPWVKILG
jgi:DNA-binding XRE family transcriptional regulator